MNMKMNVQRMLSLTLIALLGVPMAATATVQTNENKNLAPVCNQAIKSLHEVDVIKEIALCDVIINPNISGKAAFPVAASYVVTEVRRYSCAAGSQTPKLIMAGHFADDTKFKYGETESVLKTVSSRGTPTRNPIAFYGLGTFVPVEKFNPSPDIQYSERFSFGTSTINAGFNYDAQTSQLEVQLTENRSFLSVNSLHFLLQCKARGF